MNRKQLVRRGVWYIGERRKRRRQKGRFLLIAPILGSLARPALAAIASPVIKKYLVVKGDDNQGDMRKDKILLGWRVTPRRVTLPNWQSFVAIYERVSRKSLRRNVTIKRAQQTGRRRQRKRKTHKDSSLLGNIVNLETKALTSTGLL